MKYTKLQILAVPAFLMLGLGINSVFGPSDTKIHFILENDSIGYGFLAVGGLLGVIALVLGAKSFRE